ncbi:MAG: putative lipid II flippase FtsW [Chloroflexota bacterium]|nr:MAG: putative lipid II flippase FtsW [Chloroflexota bacterium]
MPRLLGRRREVVRGNIRPPDVLLIVAVVTLLLLGLESVYSASFVMALAQYDNPMYFVARQSVWAAIGTGALFVLMSIDYHRWRRWTPLILFVVLLCVALVLLPGFGRTQYGATRWLRLGPLPEVQPSEFLKLGMVMYLAAWMAGKRERIGTLHGGLIPFAIIIGSAAVLTLMQSDLGTTLIIVATAGTMFFIGGGSLRYMAPSALLAAVVAVPVVLGAGYRQGRMESFLDPWSDPQGKGFHIIQSLIALGSGGWTGLGLGASRQKFFYLPGAHTDAIYAVIGEELGFIGTMFVLVLFALLAYRGLTIVMTARDDFGSFLAAGITAWFMYQAILNIGGITKLIPFTGVPLPFISYGGSSLAISLAATGILLNVSRYCVTDEKRATRRIVRM